jgi:hypothetical protein
MQRYNEMNLHQNCHKSETGIRRISEKQKSRFISGKYGFPCGKLLVASNDFRLYIVYCNTI